MAYDQIIDGEGISIRSKKIFKLACCDCGLVHDVVIAAGRKGTEVGLAMRRNKRATGQRRRLYGNSFKSKRNTKT